jgi:type II secretory pathway component PulF
MNTGSAESAAGGSPDPPRTPRERAIASAGLALSLAELLRAGTGLAPAVTAIAARRRQASDPLAPVFERIALAVREEGRSLFQAVVQEKRLFTDRLLALLALANLGGPLFKIFVERLGRAVRDFNALPPEALDDFPPVPDEVQEFCFLLGHLANEKASQPEVQRWLPRVFTPKLRLQATLVLARFYDQGLLLSEAFARTPPFNDPEMILAVQAGEQVNRVGSELIELAHWLAQRRVLEQRLRLTEFVVPAAPSGDNGISGGR